MKNVERGLSRTLITGGTSGIGAAVSELLLLRGASVVMTGRDGSRIKDLLEAFSGRAHFIPCDLRDVESVVSLAKEASDLMGGLDGVVHGAGVVAHAPLLLVSEEELLKQMEVNLLAPIRLTRGALPLLSEGGGVVFLSSTLGERPILTSAIYSSAKAGLDGFMRAVALEGAPRGIRSNSVVLGMVDTPMIRRERAHDGRSEEERLQAYGKLHPLGRLGESREVAEVICEVLERKWMTGARLVFDGGLLLKE